MSTLITENLKRSSETASRSLRGVAAARGIFEGVSSNTLSAALNMSSVTDLGTGNYRFNFSSAFVSVTDIVFSGLGGTRINSYAQVLMFTAATTSSATTEASQPTTSTSTLKTAVDMNTPLVIHGDLA